MTKKLTTTEWYTALVEECRDIITEAVHISRWALVEGYHQLGSRILIEHGNFERAKVYGLKIVERVTNSLNEGRVNNQPKISTSTIYKAIQFARKYPILDTVPEGKAISWHKICNKYLPKPKEPTAKQPIEKTNKCPQCGYQY